MNMGIIALCFNGGGFHSVYSCWLLPCSYEGNHVQSCLDYHLMALYLSNQSHGRGISVLAPKYFKNRS